MTSRSIQIGYPHQGLQEKFYKAEKDCFGPWGQADTSLKIEDFTGPFWLSGSRTDVLAEPPSPGSSCHCPCSAVYKDTGSQSIFLLNFFLNKFHVMKSKIDYHDLIILLNYFYIFYSHDN